LKAALVERTRKARLHAAVTRLAEERPDHSARFAFTGWQGWLVGTALTGIPAMWLFFPDAAEITLHVSVSLFFLSCVLIRFAAAIGTSDAEAQTALRPFLRADLPHYAVLVAAYKEVSVAAQLVAALSRLKWPPSKLDIIIACEDDDSETIAAFEACGLPPHMRVVTVAEGGPRTKPKALMSVLPLVHAEYVVLYDAEDRPHPEQLLEAWQAFSSAPHVACVQAPLHITNGGRSFIARLFAFEYAAIFRGLLPHLARHGRYVPLGGTSNHFRVGMLRASGGWDPYNVTEDADLGLRLHAFGHGITTISRPTLEDAPEHLKDWRNQRTRWMKGYMQTWLVSLRRPVDLTRRIGWRSMFTAQTLLGGVVVSALAHPFVILSLPWSIGTGLSAPSSGVDGTTLAAVFDATSVLAAYAAFIGLGYVSSTPVERRMIRPILIMLPLYWLAISWAAWRAAFQLVTHPHIWEKTPHSPAVPSSQTEYGLG
jgi:cellulose synthase/poly-beta-1,6-N-acetylglucosamine synthase-like glycosyltransferase